jgi:hypothetical protein
LFEDVELGQPSRFTRVVPFSCVPTRSCISSKTLAIGLALLTGTIIEPKISLEICQEQKKEENQLTDETLSTKLQISESRKMWTPFSPTDLFVVILLCWKS